MITPDEIKNKAIRLYAKVVDAWLNGEDIFPHELRSSKKLSNDIAQDIVSIQALRDGSKAERGYGYSVEWTQRRTKSSGRNDVPTKIHFETQTDLLKLAGKVKHFESFTLAVEKIRMVLPELESWIHSNVNTLTQSSDDVDDLINVTQWFREHPQPDCFAREIPLPLHGKFIEDHRTILGQWFNENGILPQHAIRPDETNFFRRYYLRDAEPLITVRCLASETQTLLGLPCAEASVPVEHLNSVDLTGVRIFVVENLTNLRTFPDSPNGLVLFGMGNGASRLQAIHFLRQVEVVYWGDLDVFGLRILSTYRSLVGKARSLFMDIETIERFPGLMQTPKKNYPPQGPPAHLLPKEAQAFTHCDEQRLQLEQERIPQAAVLKAIRNLGD